MIEKKIQNELDEICIPFGPNAGNLILSLMSSYCEIENRLETHHKEQTLQSFRNRFNHYIQREYGNKFFSSYCEFYTHYYDWENRKPKLIRNRDYWINKIERNMARDKRVNKELTDIGWTPIRIWAKDVLKNTQKYVEEIEGAIQSRNRSEKERN